MGTFQKVYELYYVELNVDLWLYYDISKVNSRKHRFMWPLSSRKFEYSKGGFLGGGIFHILQAPSLVISFP